MFYPGASASCVWRVSLLLWLVVLPHSVEAAVRDTSAGRTRGGLRNPRRARQGGGGGDESDAIVVVPREEREYPGFVILQADDDRNDDDRNDDGRNDDNNDEQPPDVTQDFPEPTDAPVEMVPPPTTDADIVIPANTEAPAPSPSCPPNTQDSLYHCDDPTKIEFADPEIKCDPDTCKWDVTLFVAEHPPGYCKSIGDIQVGTDSEGEEQALPEFLEPCVLWNTLYQGPTQAPSVKTSSPSLAPVDEPTDPNDDAPAAAAPVPTPETNAPIILELDAILLNYFFSTAEAESQLQGDHVQRLMNLTSRHIHTHLQEVFETDAVEQVQVALNPVSTTTPYQNDTVISTQAVLTQVYFAADHGTPRSAAIQSMVQDAFEGSPLDEYAQSLATSGDIVLKRVYQVHVGLLSDINSTTTTTTSDEEGSDKLVNKIGSLVEWGDWSDTYFIIVVAASSAALVFLCCLCVVLCGVRRRRRRHADLKANASGGEDTLNAMSPESCPKFCNLDLVLSDNPDVSFVPPIVEPRKKAMLIRTVTPQDVARIDEGEEGHDDGAVDRINNSRNTGPYSPAKTGVFSDETSVYSYLDNPSILTEDDGGYSLGGGQQYNAHIPGDDVSGQWSVLAMGNPLAASMARATNNAGPSALGYISQETTPSNKSLSMDLATPGDGPSADLLIFADESESDDVSLLSNVMHVPDEEEKKDADKDDDSKMASVGRPAMIAAAFKAGTYLLSGTSNDSRNQSMDSSTNGLLNPVSPPKLQRVTHPARPATPDVPPVAGAAAVATPVSSHDSDVSPAVLAASQASTPQAAGNSSSGTSATTTTNVTAMVSSNSDCENQSTGSTAASSLGPKPLGYQLRSTNGNQQNISADGTLNVPKPLSVQTAQRDVSTDSAVANTSSSRPFYTMPSMLRGNAKKETKAGTAAANSSKPSYVLRSKAFKKWGVPAVPNKKMATTTEAPPSSSANLPPGRKVPFGFTSRASQIVLAQNSPNRKPQQTARNEVIVDDVSSYQESESDIQSICSKDVDSSAFFKSGMMLNKGVNNTDEFRVGHLPSGSALLNMDCDDSLLGGTYGAPSECDEDSLDMGILP